MKQVIKKQEKDLKKRFILKVYLRFLFYNTVIIKIIPLYNTAKQMLYTKR
jgi:hypothetical protein